MTRNLIISSLCVLTIGLLECAVAMDNESNDPRMAGVAIHFKADRAGFVTLVMEDKAGIRLQNLVFDHPVQVGDNIKEYKAGDEIWIPSNERHRLSCNGDKPVRVLEVAFGNWQQEDITRYSDDYNR